MGALNNDKKTYFYSKTVENANFFACILVYSWMIIPYVRVMVGVKIFLVVFFLWVITTDLKWLIKKWSSDMVYVLILFLSFIPLALSGTLRYGTIGATAVLINFFLFFVGLFIVHYYMHYKRDYHKLSTLGFLSILMYLFGSIQTINGLTIYPMASRELAGVAWGDPAVAELYTRQGIGGFGFIYSVSFVAISIIYLVKKNENSIDLRIKVVSLFVFVICSIMIFKASYTIAIIILVLGVGLILLVKNKGGLVVGVALSIALFLVIPKNFLAVSFFRIGDWFRENAVLNQRFYDLGFNILGGTTSGFTVNRLSLYGDSITAFLKNPMFGIYGLFGNSSQAVGGHSGWFDFLAFYGLFSGIPLAGIFITNIRKHLNYFANCSYSLVYLITALLLFIYGFINPIINVFEIGFAFFAVVPIVPFIPVFSRKKADPIEFPGEKE